MMWRDLGSVKSTGPNMCSRFCSQLFPASINCFGPGSQLPDSAPGLASPPTSLWALSSGSSGLGSSCPQPPPTDTRGHYSLNWSVPSGCAGSPQSSWPLKVACSNHGNHLKFPSLFGHHGRLPRDWLQSPQGLPKGLGQILLLI